MYTVMTCEVLHTRLVNRASGYAEGICNLRMRMRLFIKMIIAIMRETCRRFHFFHRAAHATWTVNCRLVDVTAVTINR